MVVIHAIVVVGEHLSFVEECGNLVLGLVRYGLRGGPDMVCLKDLRCTKLLFFNVLLGVIESNISHTFPALPDEIFPSEKSEKTSHSETRR